MTNIVLSVNNISKKEFPNLITGIILELAEIEIKEYPRCIAAGNPVVITALLRLIPQFEEEL